MITTRKFEGLVVEDPYGSWSDCSPGIYIEEVSIIDGEEYTIHESVESIFNNAIGKKLLLL